MDDEDFWFNPMDHDPTRASYILPAYVNPNPTPAKPSVWEYPRIKFKDIASDTEVQDFVEDVLVMGALHVVYGQSHAGKTWWVLDIALHVGAGRKWRDKAVDQGLAIYISLEGAASFKLRVDAWGRHFDPERNGQFAMIETPMNLCEVSDISQLVASIKSEAAEWGVPVKLIVIDTMARAMAGRSENDPKDLGLLVAHCGTLASETGAAVLLVHHSGKDESRGARGHTLLKAATDVEIEVTKLPTGGHLAHVKKHRDFGDGAEYPFKLTTCVLGLNRRGKDKKSAVIEHTGDIVSHTPTPKTDRLSEPMRKRVSALKEYKRIVADQRFSDDIKDGMLHRDKWRDAMYERVGGNRNAFRMPWTRLLDWFVDHGHIELNNGYVKLINDFPDNYYKLIQN